MSDGAVIVAIAEVGVGLLGVLVPLVLTLGRRIDAVAADLAATRTELRADVADVRRDVAEVRRDLRDLGERVPCIEGALTGPWRPAGERWIAAGIHPGGRRIVGIGSAQSLAAAGAGLTELQQAGGWRSPTTAALYVRAEWARRGPVARRRYGNGELNPRWGRVWSGA